MSLLVRLAPLYHRRQESIALRFNERELERLVRTLPQARWSGTYRIWCVPLTKFHYRLLVEKLKGAGVDIDTSLLKHYLQQRKTLLPVRATGTWGVFSVNQTQASLLLNKQLCPKISKPTGSLSNGLP